MLYQCVILRVAKQEGKPIEYDEIIVAPEWLLATDEEGAKIKMAANHSHMIEEEVKVLCRPFV